MHCTRSKITFSHLRRVVWKLTFKQCQIPKSSNYKKKIHTSHPNIQKDRDTKHSCCKYTETDGVCPVHSVPGSEPQITRTEEGNTLYIFWQFKMLLRFSPSVCDNTVIVDKTELLSLFADTISPEMRCQKSLAQCSENFFDCVFLTCDRGADGWGNGGSVLVNHLAGGK